MSYLGTEIAVSIEFVKFDSFPVVSYSKLDELRFFGGGGGGSGSTPGVAQDLLLTPNSGISPVGLGRPDVASWIELRSSVSKASPLPTILSALN